MKESIIISFIFFFVSVFTQCTHNILPPSQNTITIAAICNTRPISPFKDMPENRKDLINSINKENPDIVVHTGNIIFGGHSWMGLSEEDVVKQYKKSIKLFSHLTAPFYPVAGSFDSFNKTFGIYSKMMKRPANYSFNFDNTHFVVLNTNSFNKKNIAINKKWLLNDLEYHKHYSEIIILTHNPILTPRHNKFTGKNAETLHKIFTKYNIKLVISGNKFSFYEKKHDNIQYINIHSECFEDNYKCRYAKQLYIIKYKNGIVSVVGKTVTEYNN